MPNIISKPKNFPNDITLALPPQSKLPQRDQHFLIYIPWDESYLKLIPEEFRVFFKEILPDLSVRTTDVHVAVCLQYLDGFIAQAQTRGLVINRKVVAYALILHDIGWSQMTEEEIAASLGVRGLALSQASMGPKEKHAVLGEKLARKILREKKNHLKLTESEIELICKAILYHDRPEEVNGLGQAVPAEVQFLVDLDHLWSFTHFNFWQDTLRKGVDPKQYLVNLKNDLNNYFVTSIGKDKAKQMLAEREREVRTAELANEA